MVGYSSKNEAGAPMSQGNRPVEPQAKDVTIQTYRHDKYKRTIAEVLLFW